MFMQRLTDVSTDVADTESGSLKELDCELNDTITSIIPSAYRALDCTL